MQFILQDRRVEEPETLRMNYVAVTVQPTLSHIFEVCYPPNSTPLS